MADLYSTVLKTKFHFIQSPGPTCTQNPPSIPNESSLCCSLRCRSTLREHCYVPAKPKTQPCRLALTLRLLAREGNFASSMRIRASFRYETCWLLFGSRSGCSGCSLQHFMFATFFENISCTACEVCLSARKRRHRRERRPQRPWGPTWLFVGSARVTSRDEPICSVAVKHVASSAEVGPGICAPQPPLGDRRSTSTKAQKAQRHSMSNSIGRSRLRHFAARVLEAEIVAPSL